MSSARSLTWPHGVVSGETLGGMPIASGARSSPNVPIGRSASTSAPPVVSSSRPIIAPVLHATAPGVDLRVTG